jgi:mRNA-degrading endonuclease RelE of RelBE toxin-antitoxin system
MRKNPYTIQWDAQAAKAFSKIKEQKLKDHILSIIENEIAKDPMVGKPLTGPFAGVRSFRSGVLRILYKFYAGRLVIVILNIDHRKSIYRRG